MFYVSICFTKNTRENITESDQESTNVSQDVEEFSNTSFNHSNSIKISVSEDDPPNYVELKI